MTHPFLTPPHRTLLALSAPVMVSLAAEPLTALVDTAIVAVTRRIGLTGQQVWRDAGRLFAIGLDLFLRTGALLLFLALATRAANRLGAAPLRQL